MQRGLSRRATTVGVNGDFFSVRTGRPSGIFLRDGVLAAKPNLARSALAIAFDGTLLVDRLRLIGSWRVSSNAAHPVEEVNRPLLDPPGVAVFTPMWGGPTPRVRGAVEVVLGGFPQAVLNGFLTGRVMSVRRHGGTWVPPGGAILQARGLWRDRLLAEAPSGTPVTVHLRIDGLPTDSADAIGGGPALVRGGLPSGRPTRCSRCSSSSRATRGRPSGSSPTGESSSSSPTAAARRASGSPTGTG